MTKPTPAPHQIALTVAAAQLLLRIAGTTACERPMETVLVGEWVETHLADLPKPPTEPGKDGTPKDWQTFGEQSEAWGRKRLKPLPATDRQRDALRGLLKRGLDKIPASPPGAVLLRAFGFADEG